MKLSLKLPLAFGIVLLLMLAGGLFGIFKLSTSINQYDVEVRALVDAERKASEAESRFSKAVQAWKNILLRGKDPAKLKQYESEFQTDMGEVNALGMQLQSALAEGPAKTMVVQMLGAIPAAHEKYAKALEAFKTSDFSPSEGDKAASGADRKIGQLLRDMQDRISKDAAAVSASTSASAQRNAMLSIAVMLVIAVLGMVGSLWLVRGILAQLGADPSVAAALAQKVASGDLLVPIQLKGGDTLSLMAQLGSMQASLYKVVSHVRSSSEAVLSASAEISSNNNSVSARTEKQASALEETAASMEELGSTVRQNSDTTRRANALAENASTIAAKGGAVVAQVVDTMKGINESSRKIADIISVIDGIAFQTNILALNAAVEAARAGEQGRGFAVVASEVRSLAGRSADAAKEIKSLINASVERVAHGSALVDQAGATMTEVVESIRLVTDLMAEISTASREQAAGVSQIGEAVTQMDKNTQQNSAMVEEMAAAALGLKSLAQELVQAVSVFNLGERPLMHRGSPVAPATSVRFRLANS